MADLELFGQRDGPFETDTYAAHRDILDEATVFPVAVDQGERNVGRNGVAPLGATLDPIGGFQAVAERNHD